MNETNRVETQLRSWTPRRPSAGLERGLFGAAGSAPPDERAVLRVLISTAACLIFTMAILNHPDHRDGAVAAGPGAIMALSLSNQNYAAYLPGSFACEANRLDSFRWTNGGASPSSASSISLGKTND